MKPTVIGLISDTHGLLRESAIEALQGCSMILHAGDVGDPSILQKLKSIAAVTAVRGNMDQGEWAGSLADFEVIGLNNQLTNKDRL